MINKKSRPICGMNIRCFHNSHERFDDCAEYQSCIRDLAESSVVKSMDRFTQHGDMTCLDHCYFVSYSSFLICRRLRLDYRSAARAGLLHDLFLYDWHIKASHGGLHAFTHPGVALRHANRHFSLNGREKDIILKHMWPLTPAVPRYRESFIVSLVDKYCALMEVLIPKFYRFRNA